MASYNFDDPQWKLPDAFNQQQDTTMSNPQPFQIPVEPFDMGAPHGVTQFGSSPERTGQAPETNWWDKLNFNPDNQTGMDNVFRAGGIGVSGLGAFLQMRDNQKANKARDSAISYMQSQANPNAQLFESRIMDMLDRPAGYLDDPVDNAMSQQAEQSALMRAQRSGRTGLSRDDMLSIQKMKQNSYQQRLKQLSDLYSSAQGRNAQVASGIGNIMSQAPKGNAQAYTGFLKDLYSGGRDIAASSGIATSARQGDSNYDALRALLKG